MDENRSDETVKIDGLDIEADAVSNVLETKNIGPNQAVEQVLADNTQDQFTTKKLITVLVSVFSLLSLGFGGFWLYLNWGFWGFSGELYVSDNGYSIELPDGFNPVAINEDTVAPIPSYLEGFKTTSGDEINIFNKYSVNFESDIEDFIGEYDVTNRTDSVINGMRTVQFSLESGLHKQIYSLFEGSESTLYVVQAKSSTLSTGKLLGSISTFDENVKRLVSNKCYSFNLPLKYATNLTNRGSISDSELVVSEANCENLYVVTIYEDPVTKKVIYSEQGSNYVMTLQTRVSSLAEVYGVDTSINNIAATLAVIAQNAGATVEMSEIEIDGTPATLIKTISSSRNQVTSNKTTSFLLLAQINGSDYGLDGDFLQLSYSDALGEDADKTMNQIINSWQWTTE